MADETTLDIPDLTVDLLTEATLTGTGVFDVLMRANKAHLEDEFKKSRLTGPEYSTVYLGSLTAVMNTALQFLLQKDKNKLEAKLLEQQIILAKVAVDKAAVDLQLAQAELTTIPYKLDLAKAQTDLVKQQVLNTKAEYDIIVANGLKIPAEIEQTRQQTVNLKSQDNQIQAQTKSILAQVDQLAVQTRLIEQQVEESKAKVANLAVEKLKSEAEVRVLDQNVLNSQQQVLLTKNQVRLVDQQVLASVQETYLSEQKTRLTAQQVLNSVTENTVLVAQECKIRAEYDLTLKTVTKTDQEIALLGQKTASERAQTSSTGVDPLSIIGRQATLYAAQAAGFKKDGIQKAAKILVDTWTVRRSTDDATVADGTNKLSDQFIGQAVQMLLDVSQT